MPKRKATAARDAVAEFLAGEAQGTRCRLCNNEEARGLVEDVLTRAAEARVPVRQPRLLDLLHTETSYTGSLSAIQGHLRRCSPARELWARNPNSRVEQGG